MKNRITVFILLLFSISVIYSQNLVVGYYPNWLKSALPPNKIKFENLTHIIHAFAWPTSTGGIEMYSGMPDAALIQAAHNANKKVLMAFGGWGQSGGFAPTVADSTKREYFIENIIQLISSSGLDGIDIDWEYPANTDEGKNLTKFIHELRERFNQIDPALLITMAVSASSYGGQHIEFEKIMPDMDWVGMMGYDFHGSWTTHAGHNAPLYSPSSGCYDGASDGGIKYLTINRNVPAEKLLIGIPFYGREFTSSGLYQTHSGVTELTYTTIAPRLSSTSWEYHWDNISQVSYLQNIEHTKVVTFDDTASIRTKCEYAINKQLAGVMIWAIGQDIVGNSQPLIETVGRTMGLLTSISPSENINTSDFKLFDNYPNPFNSLTTFEFQISSPSGRGFVSLKVYDILGEEAATIVNKELVNGTYKFRWDAGALTSGAYFYQLKASNSLSAEMERSEVFFIDTKKLILIK